jgi:hypothetical protein
VLATLAVGAGYLNAPALKIYWFEHQTESSIGLPIDHGDDEVDEALGDGGSRRRHRVRRGRRRAVRSAAPS